MSDLITAMEAGSAYIGEHSYRRVLAGDVESVRARLVYALERFDYRVLSDQPPLQARRAARKGMIDADYLDLSRKLIISLRTNSATATTATFDFTVVHAGIMTRGDRQTLEREADAIIALANARPAAGVCAACGTENNGDSRFCRLCGTPNAVGEPAEIEVMRLTAGARAAHQEIVVGLAIMLGTVALSLPLLIFTGPKGAKAGWILFVIGQLVAWWMLAYGVRRLHRTLNPKGSKQKPALSDNLAPSFPAAQVSALPEASSRMSVTEGTTELLGTPPRERVAVPLRRKSGDTDPIR